MTLNSQNPEETLFFLFVGLTLGSIVSYILSNYASALPYTMVQFVLGMVIAQVYGYFGGLESSISQWLTEKSIVVRVLCS